MYEKNWDLSEWPGHIFDESDVQTSALLGEQEKTYIDRTGVARLSEH